MTLIVTDSFGRRASASAPVTINATTLLNGALNPQTFDCENPAKGEQPDRADCVKTYGFGILDVNSRGKVTDCFQISQAGPARTRRQSTRG